MGAIHGNLRRHPSDIGNERFICEEKRNHRKTLWKCKGESWISLYTDVRKSPDENEGRAYICVYEFEKVSKDKGKMGIAGGEKNSKNFYFEHNSFDKRKMALGCKSKSHFVYSLKRHRIFYGVFYFPSRTQKTVLKEVRNRRYFSM